MAPLRRKPKRTAQQQPTIEIGDGAAIPRRKDVGLFTAWRVAFFGAIAMVLYLIFFTPDPYRRIIVFVPDGIWVTFKVTIGEP